MSLPTGKYTVGSSEDRAKAMMQAQGKRQRQLVMGLVPWSAKDKHRWNQHHYRRGAWNLVARIRAAGLEARFRRVNTDPARPAWSSNNTLVLYLGAACQTKTREGNDWPCECSQETHA